MLKFQTMTKERLSMYPRLQITILRIKLFLNVFRCGFGDFLFDIFNLIELWRKI